MVMLQVMRLALLHTCAVILDDIWDECAVEVAPALVHRQRSELAPCGMLPQQLFSLFVHLLEVNYPVDRMQNIKHRQRVSEWVAYVSNVRICV